MASHGQRNSIVNSTVTFTYEEPLIFLAMKKGGCGIYHSLLLIEYLEEVSKHHVIRVADFIPVKPDGSNNYGDNYYAVAEVFSNPLKPGGVRNTVYRHNSEDLKKKVISVLDRRHQKWKVSRSQLDTLNIAIISDEERAKQGLLQFVLGGGRRATAGHNCITWAQEKLSGIGVNAVNESVKWQDEYIAARPENHVPRPEESGGCNLM